AIYSLGDLYFAQSRLKEAETMYQRALEGYEKALGPDHTSTLKAGGVLGRHQRPQVGHGQKLRTYPSQKVLHLNAPRVGNPFAVKISITVVPISAGARTRKQNPFLPTTSQFSQTYQLLYSLVLCHLPIPQSCPVYISVSQSTRLQRY
ncbi:hypothetical protein QBC32DRAFT_224997, partial [Pseudoneurospora amorphoporcata]